MIEVDLRRFPLLATLAHPELDAVASRLEVRELEADELVWREGEHATGLLLLEQGALRIESRRDGALGRCEAPACLGAASLLGEGQRESTAFAAGAARVLLLSRTAFASLLEESPRAAARLLSAIAADLARTLRDSLPLVFDERARSSKADAPSNAPEH